MVSRNYQRLQPISFEMDSLRSHSSVGVFGKIVSGQSEISMEWQDNALTVAMVKGGRNNVKVAPPLTG